MATHLVDKSAWARLVHPGVDPHWAVDVAAGRVAITGIVMMEILYSARTTSDFAADRSHLESMPRRALNESIVDRALEVQGLLVAVGTHRAPSPADLLIAACAEVNGLAVLHYDKDFDLIAHVTGQPTEWIAPPGSVP